MSAESVLSPGEEVRFERHPTGWPPLTGRVVVGYGAILALVAFPVLGGVLVTHAVRGRAVPVPFMGAALALLALVEALRFAAFRSRLYVVTTRRVLVLGGILRQRLRGELERERVRGMQLLGGEPAVALEERKLALSGLDAADLDTVRAVLGDPPLLPPVALRRRRRWRRPLAALAALLFAAFVELEGWTQRRGAREFQATSRRVGAALVAAEAAVCSLVAAETGEPVARHLGKVEDGNLLVEQTRYHAWIKIGGYPGLVSIETRCERTKHVVPIPTRVTVIASQAARENDRFLDELRLELAKLEIEASWPP